ncbi:MAG TPA: hypothetical protein VHM26_17750 [Chitinophagaceae bacterium]|nr:hypothetical protein [Chitinophagaceae bacterium]
MRFIITCISILLAHAVSYAQPGPYTRIEVVEPSLTRLLYPSLDLQDSASLYKKFGNGIHIYVPDKCYVYLDSNNYICGYIINNSSDPVIMHGCAPEISGFIEKMTNGSWVQAFPRYRRTCGVGCFDKKLPPGNYMVVLAAVPVADGQRKPARLKLYLNNKDRVSNVYTGYF